MEGSFGEPKPEPQKEDPRIMRARLHREAYMTAQGARLRALRQASLKERILKRTSHKLKVGAVEGKKPSTLVPVDSADALYRAFALGAEGPKLTPFEREYLKVLGNVGWTVKQMRGSISLVGTVQKRGVDLKPVIHGLRTEFTRKRRQSLIAQESRYTKRANKALRLSENASLETGQAEGTRLSKAMLGEWAKKLSAWKANADATFNPIEVRRVMNALNTKRFDTIPDFQKARADLFAALTEVETRLEHMHQLVDEALPQLSGPEADELEPSAEFAKEVERRVTKLNEAVADFAVVLTDFKNFYPDLVRRQVETVRDSYKSFSSQMKLPTSSMPGEKKVKNVFEAVSGLKKLSRASALPKMFRADRSELNRFDRFEKNAEIAKEAGAVHEFDTSVSRSLLENQQTLVLLDRLIAEFKKKGTKSELIGQKRSNVIHDYVTRYGWSLEMQRELGQVIMDHHGHLPYNADVHSKFLAALRTYKGRYERVQRALHALDERGWHERKKDVVRQPTPDTVQ